MAQDLNILILEEIQVIQEGIVCILNHVSGLRVAKVCKNLEEALAELERGWVNLIMMNLHLGKANGILLGHKFLELFPELKVVIYTVESNNILASQISLYDFQQKPTRFGGALSKNNPNVLINSSHGAMKLHGYMSIKNITPEEIKYCFELLNSQGKFLDKEVQSLLTERTQYNKLTPRELQCSEMICLGKSNKEIAEKLGITKPAVENLINVLYHKFSITGDPKDSSRRVLLVNKIRRWSG